MAATTVLCPECNRALKIAGPLPAGKRIRCPECSAVFAPGDQTEKKAAPVRPKNETPPPPVPVARVVDDDNADADRRPSRRRARDDDDMPARPRRRAAVDDDDDRDDDYEDRPRRSSRSKKPPQHTGLVIGLIGGGVGLLLAVFVLTALVWPGFLRSAGAPAAGQAVKKAALPGGNPPAGIPAEQKPGPDPGAQNPAARPPVRLTYQFKPGETYVYAVTIVADRDDATETYKGHVQLAVKSADGNVIRMTPGADLPRKVKNKRPAIGGPPIGPPPLPPLGPPMIGARELAIDLSGKQLSSSGDAPLPYLLGNATDLAIEPLSPLGENRWERGTDVTIREIKRLFPFAPLGPRSESNSTAREVVTCELAGAAGPVVRIKKKFELKTIQADQGAPRIQLEGQGEIAFDTAVGAVKSCDYQGTLTLSEKNVTVRVPLTISYRLLDAVETASYKKEQEERRAKILEAAKHAAAAKPITDAEITKALADLKSSNLAIFRAATDRLARSIPVEARRDEVAGALEALLEERDGNRRADAAKALKAWATPKNIPALIKLLNDDNLLARHAALEGLGRVKDARGAEAVAPLLSDIRVRLQAVAALKAMGSLAQKPVLAVLKHREWSARIEACKVLADIGTKDVLPGLQAALADSNRLVGIEAQKAIKAIEGRSAAAT